MIDSNSRRPHLAYLDGLRGLTAVYVVLAHIWLVISLSDDESRVPSFIRNVSSLLTLGHFAVAIFIVLSGYCLMIPVARNGGRNLPDGLRSFALRRAWRILPPYYAALVLSLLAIACFAPLRDSIAQRWATCVPPFSPQAILTHTFLIHNLKKEWIWSINAPLWSVAAEWQIYFVFALLLLPIRRWFGRNTTLLAAIACTALPYLVLRNLHTLERTNPWYIALFVMGMYAAEINFTPGAPRLSASTIRLLSNVALALVACAIVLVFKSPAFLGGKPTLSDLLLGAATASYLTAATTSLYARHESRQTAGNVVAPAPLQRLLESGTVVGIGGFSYSLYLVHYPLVDACNGYLLNMHRDPITRYAILLAIVFPLSIAFAYGFHLLFEKPFLGIRNKKKADITPIAALGA